MDKEFHGVIGTTNVGGYKETVVAVGLKEDGNIIAVSESTDVMVLMKSEFEEDESLKISEEFKGFVDFLNLMNGTGSHKEEILKHLRRES